MNRTIYLNKNSNLKQFYSSLYIWITMLLALIPMCLLTYIFHNNIDVMVVFIVIDLFLLSIIFIFFKLFLTLLHQNKLIIDENGVRHHFKKTYWNKSWKDITKIEIFSVKQKPYNIARIQIDGHIINTNFFNSFDAMSIIALLEFYAKNKNINCDNSLILKEKHLMRYKKIIENVDD